MDLLDISFGAASISNQAAGTSSSSSEAWGGLGATALTQPDPWSSRPVVSPQLGDPWVPSKSNSVSPALKADVGWRTQSPALTGGDAWNGGSGGATNGNSSADPWLGKPTIDPWASPKPADPWAAPSEASKDFGVSQKFLPISVTTIYCPTSFILFHWLSGQTFKQLGNR